MSDKVRWQGGYEKKARQEEGKMSDDRLIKFLDEEIESYSYSLKNSFTQWQKDKISVLVEIKETLIEHYDLIERLTNINFPIEAKRKK